MSAAATPPSSSPTAATQQRGGRRELVRTPRAESLSSSSSSLNAAAATAAGGVPSSSFAALPQRSPSASRRDVFDLTAALTEVAAASPARVRRYTGDNGTRFGSKTDAAYEGFDVIARLPVEIAVHVFSFFDDQTDLLCASLVSKTWRVYALHRTAWQHVFDRQALSGWRLIPDAERLWNELPKAYGKRRAVTMNDEPKMSISRAFTSPLAALESIRHQSDVSQKRRFGEYVIKPAEHDVLNGPIEWLRMYQARNYLKKRWDLFDRHVVPLSALEADLPFHYEDWDEDYDVIQEMMSDMTEEELDDPYMRATLRREIDEMKRNRRQPVRFEPSVRYLDGHEDSVYCIRLDSTPYRLPDAASGIDELLRHHATGPLYRADASLGFGSRGRIFSGSRDKTIKIWDGDSGICMHTLSEHRGSVLCMEFDERYLISGSSDQRVIVWDLLPMHERNERPKAVMRLRGHTSPVLDLSMTDRYMISCGKDTTVRVYDRLQGYAVLRVYTGHQGPVNAGSLSVHQGKLCAVTASGEGSIQLWDVLSGQMLRAFDGHAKGLACVKFSHGIVVSGSNDRTVRVWDATTGECILVCCDHEDLVRSIVYDHERKLVVSGCYDGRVRMYNLARYLHPEACRAEDGYWIEAWTTMPMAPGEQHPVRIFDIQTDATRVLSGGEDNRICVRDYAVDSPIMRLFA